MILQNTEYDTPASVDDLYTDINKQQQEKTIINSSPAAPLLQLQLQTSSNVQLIDYELYQDDNNITTTITIT